MNYKQLQEEKKKRCQEFLKKNPEYTFDFFMAKMFDNDWEDILASDRINEFKYCWNTAISNVEEVMMEAGATLEGQAFDGATCLTVDVDEE